MLTLFLSWLITIFVEFGVMGLFIKKDFGNLFGYSILINSATQPVANYVYGRGGSFWLIEIGVVLVEIVLIKLVLQVGWGKAGLISVVANGVTALLSVLFI